MAYTYETREEALDGARLMGGEVEVQYDPTVGLYGWDDAADDADESEVSDNAEVETVDPADRVAQDGDVVLQVGGPMTSALALLAADKLARKLGMTIVILDASTKVELQRVKRSPGKRGERSIERDERGLTTKQALFLDMAMRDEGATNRELIAAGATTGTSSISWKYVQEQITLASKGRYVRTASLNREEIDSNGRLDEVKAFRMRELPQEQWESALAPVKEFYARQKAATLAKKKAANGNSKVADAAD